MFYGLVLIGVTQIIGTFGLQCYHMNLRGESKLINCRGFCTSIYAMVSGTNIAEVNYCVSESVCLASLSPGALADRGNLICRALVENADSGVISQCKAAVCQSDGCNHYSYRSNPALNDCNIYQCQDADCHNPELVQSTLTPYVTTGALSTAAFATTESPGPLTHVKPDKPNEFETTTHFTVTTTESSTTGHNKVTTKDNTDAPEEPTDQEKTGTRTPKLETSTSPYQTPGTETIYNVSTEEPTMTSENAITTKKQTDEVPESESEVPEEEESGSGVPEEEGSDYLETVQPQTQGPTLQPLPYGTRSEAGSSTEYPSMGTSEPGVRTTTEYILETDTELPEIVTTEDKEKSTLVMDITRSPAARKNFIGTTSSSPNDQEFIDNNGYFSGEEEYELEMAGRDTIKAEGNTSSACNLQLSLSALLTLLSYVIL